MNSSGKHKDAMSSTSNYQPHADNDSDTSNKRRLRLILLVIALVFVLFTTMYLFFHNGYNSSINFDKDLIENNNMDESLPHNVGDHSVEEFDVSEGNLNETKSSNKSYNYVTPAVVIMNNISYAPPPIVPTNASSPTAVLLIKIPKVGGTSLSVTLERYCHVAGLKVAHPGMISLIGTCKNHADDLAFPSWRHMIHKNGGKIDAWVTHSCFHDFMLSRNDPSVWRSPERQLAITMLREPLSRTISAYRYVQYRCEERPELGYMTSQCGKSFPSFARHICRTRDLCSEQFHYMTGKPTRKELTMEEAEMHVNKYGLVFLTERFNQGLVVLHLKFGFPFMVLPYMLANHNTKTPYPNVPAYLKKSLLRNELQPDHMIYEAASKKMDEHIKSIGEDVFYSTLDLINEINKVVAKECKDRMDRSDCLENDPHIMHGASCFHRCVEEVSARIVSEKHLKYKESQK